MQRQENDWCPERGPELQVTRARPGWELAAHTFRFPSWRVLRLSAGCAQEQRGASGAVGAQDVCGGGGRGEPLPWGVH